MAWLHIKHGRIFEEMIGFSMPVEGQIAVICREGVHIVPLARPDGAAHHPELAGGGSGYDSGRQVFNFDGRVYPMLGLHGGQRRLRSGRGERLGFGDGEEFTVHDTHENRLFNYLFKDLAGEWRIVTFTPDDGHIILGMPYELEIFKRRP